MRDLARAHLRPLPLRRFLIDRECLRIDDHAVELGRGFDRHIPLPHVFAHAFDLALPRIAVAAAAAGADAERVAVVLQIENEFRVLEILVPLAVAAGPDRELVAGAFAPAFEAPGLAMHAVDLAVDGDRRARARQPLDAEPAAIFAGAAAVGDQRVI